MRSIISLLFLLHSIIALGQSVSTFFSSNTIQVDDGMVQDKHGNLYGSHYMGTNVYKITPNGVATVFSTGYNTPNGLAFNSMGELYVVDNIGNRIYKLDSLGNRIDTIVVSSPSGIIKSIDSDTMIFTQYAGHTLRKLSPNGVVSPPIAAGYPLSGPVGLCYGPDSSLYIGNFTDRKILKLDSGRLTYIARVPGANGTNLGFITFAGNYIYGTAFQENKIYRIDPTVLNTVFLYSGSTAGNTNGSLGQAKFNGPNGILASSGGDTLFISDFNTGDIRMIYNLSTSINEWTSQDEFSVYPNPANGFFYVNTSKAEKYLVRVMDQTGRTLNEITSYENKALIDIGHLLKGIYLIEISTEKGRMVRKLVNH